MLRNIFLSIYVILLSCTPGQAADLETYSHGLSASNSTFTFWTAPPSRRVFKDDTVPAASADAVKVYAARNEFEPFQVVVKPKSAVTATISIGDFGSGITTEIHQKIDIEGLPLIDDEGTWNPERPYLVRSRDITITDNILTMSMGIFDEYTMLNYLDIEAITPSYEQGDTDCSGSIGLEDALAILFILSDKPVNLPPDCSPLQGDRNNDNRIGMEDALDLLVFIHDL
jgi:hypothetical protein